MIHLVNSIVEGLKKDGYDLTLRQLFYALVSQGVVPNQQKQYKKLGETLSNARLTGLVDWDAIEDRTRHLRGVTHRTSPEEMIFDAAAAFRLDKWSNQPMRPEVWVEKDALVGVVAKACGPLDVDYFSCRGNTSQTAMYNAANRFKWYLKSGQMPLIIHLGDHDPSGIDMTRDITDRIALMVTESTGEEIEVRRIALNMAQVRQYNPPPNPAKEKDSRYAAYVKKYGRSSWELDALNVRVLDALITKEIISVRDDALWEAEVERETAHRDQLQDCATQWGEVTGFIRDADSYLKLQEPPLDFTDPKGLRKDLLSFIGKAHIGTRETATLILDGIAVNIPAAKLQEFISEKPATSIKTKKKNPPKS